LRRDLLSESAAKVDVEVWGRALDL